MKNLLKNMGKKELIEEFKRVFGNPPTKSEDSRQMLMEMVIKGEYGEASAPTLAEIAKNKKELTRRRRIDTPKPLRSPK